MENTLRILFYIFLCYAVLVALVVLCQNYLIYYPGKMKPDIAKAPWAKEMVVRTDDGLTLHGWWSPPQSDNHYVILYFHGNAASIENREPRGAFYHRNGVGLLFAEYRGYGGNEGSPSEEGLYRDGRAYMEWLLKEQNIDPSRIVIYGESLGTGVATQMATEYKQVRAVVLETPFLSVLSMAKYRMPFIPLMEFLLRDHYRSDLKINDFKTPVLIGVAGRDFTVPGKFAEELYALRVKDKQIVRYEHAGHTQLYDYGFGDDVLKFLGSDLVRNQN